MRHDVLIQGVEAEGGWLRERGFQFGDGLFETIAIIDEKPCLWGAHMARLAEGCDRLRLPQPDFSQLSEESRRVCAGHPRAVLKLYWTAGQSERGYRRPSATSPRRVISRCAWHQTAQEWAVRQCEHRLAEGPALAGIKHLNRLDQVIARAEWEDDGIAEGLMLGQDGRVVCGTMSNVLIQHGETLHTPAIDGAGISGVVRNLALDLARRSGNPVRVGAVTLDDVRAADALFLSNSLIGVARVRRYESTDYDPEFGEHPVISETRRLCHQPQAWGHGQ
jgi:4-amino-4-deoxychorismate lyase